MKISVNDKELFRLSEVQKKVIQNDIHEDVFYDDMCRRIQYVLMHKYERCFERLKKEWEPKLKEMGQKSIPLDDDEFAALVFSKAEYKDKASRERVSSVSNERFSII